MISRQKITTFLVLAAFAMTGTVAVAQSPAPSPSPAGIPGADAQITFNGATRYRESELRTALGDQIQAIRDSGLNPASADDAAFFLGIFYHNHGYPQADVKWKIDGSRLELDVNEGPPAVVQDAVFSGNQSISSGTLRDYLLGATRERLSLMAKTYPYIAADIQTGVERVRGLYQSQGFLDSVVDEPEIEFSADKTRVIIRVTIHEGMQYHYGKLNFTGDLVFHPLTELENDLKPFTDQPYTPMGVSNMQRKVVYFYRSRGYFDVKVAVQSDPATAKGGLVPVNFDVQSGNVYRFGHVNVTGLDQLQPGFLPARFKALQGKFYNPSKLDDLYRDMMRTGLFKSLKITSTPLPSNEVELNLDVEEAKPKEIGFAVGYGTYDGPIVGIRVGDRDLLGTGRPLLGTFEFSARLIRGELTYTDPWFLETPNKLNLRLYSLNQDWDGYSKLEEGFRVELTRKITKQLETTLFLLTRHDNITATGIAPADVGKTDYNVDSLGVAFTLDLRNKPKNTASDPGHGLIVRGAGEFATEALGSTISFVRGTLGATYYLPIKNTLLAFGARGGIVVPTTGELPIDERFFNGGSQSVRSFAERELGPRNILGNPLGGETFTTFNVEYVFPIVGDLQGAVFTDAGSVGQRVSDGIGEMRYGIGTGLRYKLPIGPLRLDYGVNPSPKQGEANGAFNFSFGFAF